MKPALLRTYFLNSATPIASNTVEENSSGLLLLGSLPNHHVLATYPNFVGNIQRAKR